MNGGRNHRCKQMLLERGVNPASTVEFDVNGTLHTLTFQEIIAAYLQTSEDAQQIFVQAMQKALEGGNPGIQKFFEGMGKLLLMSRLSGEDITSV